MKDQKEKERKQFGEDLMSEFIIQSMNKFMIE